MILIMSLHHQSNIKNHHTMKYSCCVHAGAFFEAIVAMRLNAALQVSRSHGTASRDEGLTLFLWCLGGLQTQSGLTTVPTDVWGGMECGPRGMCEAQLALKRYDCLHMKAQRNSPMLKTRRVECCL